jgi:hypothetical protein
MRAYQIERSDDGGRLTIPVPMSGSLLPFYLAGYRRRCYQDGNCQEDEGSESQVLEWDLIQDGHGSSPIIKVKELVSLPPQTNSELYSNIKAG